MKDTELVWITINGETYMCQKITSDKDTDVYMTTSGNLIVVNQSDTEGVDATRTITKARTATLEELKNMEEAREALNDRLNLQYTRQLASLHPVTDIYTLPTEEQHEEMRRIAESNNFSFRNREEAPIPLNRYEPQQEQVKVMRYGDDPYPQH